MYSYRKSADNIQNCQEREKRARKENREERRLFFPSRSFIFIESIGDVDKSRERKHRIADKMTV